MANPARPNFKDVIDNQWGQLTADRVTRRYANAAERDADLAGFAPADLAGQVCILTAAVGTKMLWQVHNGTVWVNAMQIPRPTGGAQLCAFPISGTAAVSSLSVVFPEVMDATNGGPIVTATPYNPGGYFPQAPTTTCAITNITAFAATVMFRNNGANFNDGAPLAAQLIAVAASNPFVSGPGIVLEDEPAQHPEGLDLEDLPGLVDLSDLPHLRRT